MAGGTPATAVGGLGRGVRVCGRSIAGVKCPRAGRSRPRMAVSARDEMEGTRGGPGPRGGRCGGGCRHRLEEIVDARDREGDGAATCFADAMVTYTVV